MLEAMARQFGNFLGEYMEYDTLISVLGLHKYMSIKTRIDSRLPLKRRKKILVGKDRVVYARFQYEKLSIFYFLCDKLGYGKSFCLVRVKIDSSHVIFGWDASLRALVRKRTAKLNRWLHET